MGVYQRTLIKEQQNFYRDYYRSFVTASLISLIISFLLVLAIIYYHTTRPAIRVYASNSAGFITQLNPLSEPNNTANYLLPPDPPEDNNTNNKPLNLE